MVECDWLYTADVVSSGRDVSRSVELFHRVNEQDFEACERTQPSMSSRAYRQGGVLVPAEHHIAEFHQWVVSRLGDAGEVERVDGEPDLCIGGHGAMRPTVGRDDIINPANGSIAAVVDEATPDDARDAVAAARAAFDDGAWPATPVAERAALLDRVADLLQRDKEELASLETRDTGKTLVESRIDIDDVTSVFRYYAKLVGCRSRPDRRRRRSRR